MYFAKGTEPTEYCMDHVDDKEEFEKTSEEKEKQVGGKISSLVTHEAIPIKCGIAFIVILCR